MARCLRNDCRLAASRGAGHGVCGVARLVGRKQEARALCAEHRIESSEEERQRVMALGGKIARAMDKHGRPVRMPKAYAMARPLADPVGGTLKPT